MTPPTREAPPEHVPPFTAALAPLTREARPALPEPEDLIRLLIDQMNEAISAARKARGDVQRPDDVFALVRDLNTVMERCQAYARAFTRIAASAKGAIAEEHLEAIGEQDGIPTGNLTVPSRDGDIKITRNVSNDYTYDLDQVLGALACHVEQQWIDRIVLEPDTAPEPAGAEFGLAVARAVLDLYGAKQPGVTKIRKLADDLNRAGNDDLASIVRDAIRKTVKYGGITVETTPAA